MEIRIDDLRGPEIAALLVEHLRCMAEVSPPESCHAFNLGKLRQPGVTFWSAWEGGELAGCGALRELDSRHGEIKSMRTAKAHLRKGVATKMLEHIIAEARRRGYRRLSLETGAMPYFEPARRLYRKFGFSLCPPFEGYIEDPNSVFMSRELASSIEVIGIDHIYIAVLDFADSEKFYDSVMGILGFHKNTFENEGDRHVQYYNRHFGYVLRPARSAANRHDPLAPGLHHFCLRVEDAAVVDAVAKRIAEVGVACTSPQLYPEYAPDYYALYFTDPDGIRLEVTNYRAERRRRHDDWQNSPQ